MPVSAKSGWKLFCAVILCIVIPFGLVNGQDKGLLLALSLEDKIDIIPGELIDIGIHPGGRGFHLSEFDLRIAFNTSVLTVSDVIPGPYYENNNWEYFDYRLLPPDESRPDSLSGVLRIKSVADLDDNDETPTSLDLRSDQPVVHIIFNTANDSLLIGTRQPIRFYWTGCGDNIFRSAEDDTIFICHEVRDPYTNNNITDNTLMPTIQGAPDICLVGDGPDYDKTVVRKINYYNGYIAFTHPDSVQPDPLVFEIETVEEQHQGTHAYLDVVKKKGSMKIHGFDFLIGYDFSALAFMGAVPGELFDESGDYQWEYFTYRYEINGDCIKNCPTGLVRVVALAETNDGAHHPLSMDIPNGMTLFTLDFLVSSGYFTGHHAFYPVSFYWMDCGDNVVAYSDAVEPLTVKSALSLQVGRWEDRYDDGLYGYYDVTDSTAGFPTYGGAQVECFEPLDPDKPEPFRLVNFWGGGVGVYLPAFDHYGDVNLNGIAYEIADAVLFINQMKCCNYDLFIVDPEKQAQATDVNQDSLLMTIEDLVYMIKVIVGDALPLAAISSTFPGTMEFYYNNGSINVDASFDMDVGGIYMVYQLNGATVQDISFDSYFQNMDFSYGICKDSLKILIYSLEYNAMISAGDNIQLMNLIYSGDTPELIAASAAGYYGRKVDLDVIEHTPTDADDDASPLLPDEYRVYQNQPNPFNMTTRISFDLPERADWSVEIFNIAGQRLKVFSGSDPAGRHHILWDGTGDYGNEAGSGIYLYRIRAGDFVESKKMIMLK